MNRLESSSKCRKVRVPIGIFELKRDKKSSKVHINFEK